MRRFAPYLLLALLSASALLAVLTSSASRASYENAPALDGARIHMSVQATVCNTNSTVETSITVTPAVRRAILAGVSKVYTKPTSGLIGIDTDCGFQGLGPDMMGFFEVSPGGPWHSATIRNTTDLPMDADQCTDPAALAVARKHQMVDCLQSKAGKLRFAGRAYFTHEATSMEYAGVTYPLQRWLGVRYFPGRHESAMVISCYTFNHRDSQKPSCIDLVSSMVATNIK